MAKKDIEIHLFENSLDFIYSGIKHINTDNDYNSLKYAVLHLSSGLELLLKERLRRENWALIFKNVDDADLKKYESGDFVSIYLDSTLKRLSSICGIEFSDSDKAALRRFKETRNCFEHFKVKASKEEIKGLSAEIVSIILQFVADNFKAKHITDEANKSIDKIRDELKNFSALYDGHSTRIFESNPELIDKFRAECPKCYQDFLILGDKNPRCYYCSYEDKPSIVAKAYIENVLGINHYECVKHGGVFPLYRCPDCSDDLMVFRDGEEKDAFVCFGCGLSYGVDDLSFCSECNELFHNKDKTSIICSDCQYNLVRG